MSLTKSFILSAVFLLVVPAQAETDLEREKRLSAAYLELMKAEPNAEILEEGIILRPLHNTESKQFASPEDTVRVSYHLVDRENNVIDESLTRDTIHEFPLTRLIRCWQVAVPNIPVGSLYKLSCNSDNAYGDKGAGDRIKGGAALTFRIMLHDVKDQ